ncbi:hypothetical protein [Hyphomonas sp.]|uniref:hypothetical protein n=1 Tax=Hyphomonas sp. TaxID=87 RepID=UPI0025C3B5FC|nr:hypothetical protein [Hyphomonas sp.]
MLTMSEFLDLTRNIIKDVGVENFIPVLIEPNQRIIRGLEGIPKGGDHKAAALDWVGALALDDYGLAYRQGDKIVIRLSRRGELEDTFFDLADMD